MSELHILNTDLEWVYTIDDGDSLVWTDKYNELGSFELNLPYGHKNETSLVSGNYIVLKDTAQDKNKFMVIEDRGVRNTLDDAGVQLIGSSGESILSSRVIQEPISVSGNINDVVRDLVVDNFISPNDALRTIPNVVWADNQIIQNSGLYDIVDMFETGTIYEIIETLCVAKNVGFQVLISDTPEKQIEVSLYVGVDRSHLQTDVSRVIFSQSYDNVLETEEFYSSREYKNYILMFSDDSLVSNQIIPVYISETEPYGINRKETYQTISVVRGSVTPPLSDQEVHSIIRANGETSLVNKIPGSIFDGEFDVLQPFTYGVDFNIGDFVQCNIDGVPKRAKITESVVSLDGTQSKRHVSFSLNTN